MDLFEELSSYTMPEKVKEICDQAAELSKYYGELGTLGARIKRCTKLIEMLQDKSRDPVLLEIQLRTKENLSPSSADVHFKFDVGMWPDGKGTARIIMDEFIEYLTTERITSWMAIENLINDKIIDGKQKAKRKSK